MFCKNCGAEINDNAVVCVNCGCAVNNDTNKVITDPDKSSKDWIITLLLCWFLGYLGVHSFYAGKIGIGIIQFITAGGCGIWTIIDLVMICLGNYTDGDGKYIRR